MTAPTVPIANPAADAIGHSVRLGDATVFYGEVVGLSRVSLAFAPGITGIVGPNGSGKTTMMRLLVGLVQPQEGTVNVLGGDPFKDEEIRTRISFVPATECFYDNVSGHTNLEAAFVARGETRKAAKQLADEALELVKLTADGKRAYRTWSRGMRQRLKLGLALASSSDLVLLDEPFLGVDPPSRRQLRGHIDKLGKQGKVVVVSSHVLHEVEALTDRVGVLAHGRLLGFGNAEEILREVRDQHPQRLQIEVADARAFAAILLRLPHIREVKVEGERRLTFVTEDPEAAFKEIAEVVVESEAPIYSLQSLDDTLEAVFAQVTSTGTHRL
ncbi:MAG: ABC transporter ATP-binding protein [Candidatus Eisenbacteria bacterium]|uniref:ABC transporter ATP-binding protein n=1 Tax=Eiseniibacteriota bacterium TaxID=2212470 RepID=A0A7Y2E5Q2_UNCEI|nr:ABC transporter ATP-binding protein [Candidatus Eisenbacteria bacterium]